MKKLAAFCLLLVMSLPVVAEPKPRESVRAELVRLQKDMGLTLATEDHGIYIVLFDERSLVHGSKLFRWFSTGVVSGDGTEVASKYRNRDYVKLGLGLVRSDGSDLREFPEVRPEDICLSYDKYKLAMTHRKRGSPDTGLEIMDLGTKVVSEEIDPRARLTSQCWSPDNKKIVYEADNSVRIYEIGQVESSAFVLAKGEKPTWSPDGNWIAFLDHNTYYAIRPNGQDIKKLFRHNDVYSPLWWSPDSRMGAYVTLAGLFEGGFSLNADLYQLRVRRLKDNSEAHVLTSPPGFDFQWVTSPELLRQVQSARVPN